jgi:hypothetical protein
MNNDNITIRTRKKRRRRRKEQEIKNPTNELIYYSKRMNVT